MAEKLTTEECIKRFMHIHGNQYEYVLVCYRGLEKKVIIICRTHGPFWQTPAVHFSSHCPKCALERRSKEQQISKEEFIQRADLLHNFEFDYTDTIIDGVLNIASFLHKPCNKIISQQVRYHLEGYGCKSCYFLGKMLTKEEFETKANIVHNFEFDYTNTIIDGVANKSSYLHKPCGKIVTQTPNSHLEGRGCQYCLFMTKEEFETKANIIHNYEFDYTDTIINGTKNKSNFLHKHCGKISTQRVDHHIAGQGCQHCHPKMASVVETQWLNFMNIPETNRQQTIILNGHRFIADAFDPNTNTIFEFYGDWHHGNPNTTKPDALHLSGKTMAQCYEATMQREAILKQAGYTIISIWEADWKKQRKEQQLKKASNE